MAWAADHRLGQEFSWSDVSARTDIGSKDTARRYIENAERLYLWHVLYRAQAAGDPAPALKSPKKLYPADPFAWHVLAAWAAGEADPWAGSLARLQDSTARGAFVDAVAGDHLIRAYGRFALYQRADRGDHGTEEIDFVLYRGGRQARLEIKYRETVKAVHWKHLANHGGGIIATPDDLEWSARDQVAAIPLPYLLAGYAERLSLYPAAPSVDRRRRMTAVAKTTRVPLRSPSGAPSSRATIGRWSDSTRTTPTSNQTHSPNAPNHHGLTGLTPLDQPLT